MLLTKARHYLVKVSYRMMSNIRDKVIVFGGNGYVGTSICNQLLKLDKVSLIFHEYHIFTKTFLQDVVSVSRSGAPKTSIPWKNNVKWVTGDVEKDGDWIQEFKDASAVVSCIGAFGSNEARPFPTLPTIFELFRFLSF